MNGESSRLHLISDIGGTKTRFALVRAGDAPADVAVLHNRDHSSLAEEAKAYLAQSNAGEPPSAAAFSIACPIEGDQVTLTNFDWSFSIEGLRRELGVDRLEVVNDFTAIALSLPHLKAGDLDKIGGDEPVPNAPIGLIGPGTGLGVSGLIHCAGGWKALQCEGGHVTLPTTTMRESHVYEILKSHFDDVSAERAVSGPGLVNLYEALSEIEGKPAERLEPREVAERASNGSDPISSEAARMFSAILGTVSGDLALTLGAKGGVYIGGGVVRNMGPAFDREAFRKRFEAKGRLRSFVAPIPVYLITYRWPGLMGLSHLLADPPA
ncbi:MAG: glucokinase [Alphaproteobacteria bacterium]